MAYRIYLLIFSQDQNFAVSKPHSANKPYPYSNIQPQLSRRPREEATGVPVYGILVLYSPLLLPYYYRPHHCLSHRLSVDIYCHHYPIHLFYLNQLLLFRSVPHLVAAHPGRVL